MHWIFVSADHPIPESITTLTRQDTSFCNPNGPFVDEAHFRTRSKCRSFACYASAPIDEQQISISGNELEFFHGYLLDRTDTDHLGRSDANHLSPKRSYYGVYSHGFVSDVNCWFASDEIGLSPIYYSSDDAYTIISNNAHLIAFYKRKLGYTLKPELTLAVWHTIGLTIESNKTGYEGILRILPWRYLELDFENTLFVSSKERLDLGLSYQDYLRLSIQELRGGLEALNAKFPSIRVAQLTGGLDSRLVAAFLLDSGLTPYFTFETEGSDQNADVIVAKMVAQQQGLDHKVTPRNPIQGDLADIDSIVKDELWANVMETSLTRFYGRKNTTEAPKLNGFGAVFAKSLWFASSFRIFMEKHFGKGVVDFDNLTPEQVAYGKECFGYSDSDRQLLTDHAFGVSSAFRSYIMDYNHLRFPDHMNYADGLSAYRWRTHNANFRSMDNNLVFLYSPVVLEAARQLSPELRQEGKLYFDMMWQLNKELTMIPFENRTLNPILFEEYPAADREHLSNIPPVKGGIVSETQMSLFDQLLPFLEQNLIDMLPSNVFDYIKRDALAQRLKEQTGFSKQAFPLINLYGIAKWHELIDELNAKVH